MMSYSFLVKKKRKKQNKQTNKKPPQTYSIMTVALKQNKSDPSCFKLDDALPETIRTKPTTRTNLACFTRDKVSKHDVCPQGTWGQLGRLIKETAACYFIGYYVGAYRHAGVYLIFNLKTILADTNNMPIISCIPN